MSVSRLAAITKIGVEQMGDLADGLPWIGHRFDKAPGGA